MTALTASRRTPTRSHRSFTASLAAATMIYAGALVAINASGYLVPASADATLRIVGIAAQYADNSAGANGAIAAKYTTPICLLANSAGGDAIAAANVGAICYAVDDQTVALTSGGGARPVAGEIVSVDADGVWVDVATAAAIRTSPLVLVEVPLADLSSTDTYFAPSPVAGEIVKIWSTIDAALTTGDATLTGKIGATPITNGVITVTQSGSAAGDVDSASPTAANTVAAGDALAVTIGGTNASAVAGRATFAIRPT